MLRALSEGRSHPAMVQCLLAAEGFSEGAGEQRAALVSARRVQQRAVGTRLYEDTSGSQSLDR